MLALHFVQKNRNKTPLHTVSTQGHTPEYGDKIAQKITTTFTQSMKTCPKTEFSESFCHVRQEGKKTSPPCYVRLPNPRNSTEVFRCTYVR